MGRRFGADRWLRGVVAGEAFRRLWFSGLANDFGDEFARLALSVTSVLVLHASSFQVGLIAALGRSAYLLFGIPIGVWVDRWFKRPVLIAAELVRAVAVVSIPVAYVMGTLSIWQVMVVSALVSVADVFFDTAHTSVLPSLVGRDQVSEANARLQTSDATMGVVGPAAAGQLLRLVSGPVLYITAGVTSLISAGLLGTMKVHEPAPANKRDRESFRSSLKIGIGYVITHPALRTFMCTSAAINLGAGMFMAVLPLLVLRDLALTPQVYGLALGIGGLGGIVGSLVGLPIRNRFGEVRTMLLMQCGMPFAFAILPLAVVVSVPPVLLVGLSEVLFGSLTIIHVISSTGIRAKVTPHHLMGRVTAASRFVTLGAVPVGALIGGAVGGWLGHPGTVLVAAGLAATAPIILLTSPLGRLRTVPEQWEAERWSVPPRKPEA